ncbi:MAG TPA: S8 family serine peptidase [Pirellulaceae bacterium]|nr:S8 family serine peptidase [Pirellulaceae bacterium]
MARSHYQSLTARVLFESLEDRLALSIDPAADFWLDEPVIDVAIEQHDRRIEAHELLSGVTQPAANIVRDYGFTGDGQTVVVIDSGIAYDHVALGGGYGSGYQVVGGWDFAENDADPYDDGPGGFHGTHVAGIIGASDTRYGGLASGVDLVALRVFDDQGNGYFSWVEQALQWVHQRRNAFANPITTVNLSLGSQWNSASLPKWAMLEDELKQLEQDGIFVAVSAGNSFQQYNAAGLSYPAVSEYVVPVASVDASGNLSRFSQRHDRVLAAPGERITSTVPDHYYGGDGIKNDFGAASGTSMAAPYVAAASVLVRQAMQAAGQMIVTPDGIYEHLRTTADSVYDSVTQSTYRRVNLERALESLQGSDQPSLPSYITIGPGGQIDVFGTAGDDTFAFSGGTNATIVVNGVSHSLPGSSQVRFHGLAGSDTIQITGTSAAETATIGVGSLTFSGPGFTVRADAIETVRIAGGIGDRALLYDSPGSDFFDAGPHSGLLRGDGFYHFVSGFSEVSAYATSGGTDIARLYDSAGNDYFDAGPKSGVLRGRGFYLYAGSFDELHAHATAGGYDRARLYDSSKSDWFDAGPASALMRGSEYYNRAWGFDEVQAHAIWGGFDQANLYGSSGSDRLDARGTSRILVGRGYQLRADDFEQVRVFGQGGIDQALFHELGSGDHFYGRKRFGRLTAAAVATELYDFDDSLLRHRRGEQPATDVQALEYVFRQTETF